MATLILTAVGSAVGGPVGGAIGALVGGTIDRSVLAAPGRRDGPRLTQLAVQTSSYGTQIPRLFGTLRVAGTVIWSTDLIETRATAKAGKGQPSVTTYSYAASFAVLLSARPIVGVGRIWADGNLLRGAAGDWKAATGFRLYLGDEEQQADPLIASAVGLDRAPAYRGCAYAVFDTLQLASFANRIPSLTFEVIADAAPVGVGTIAADLAPTMASAVALPLGGFAASGGSAGAVIEAIATAAGAWMTAGPAGLALRDAGPAEATVADDGVVAAGNRVAGTRIRSVAAIETVPRTLSLSYYDPARDYQAGVQQARRPGPGERDQRLELAAAIEAGAAKTIAAAALARAEAGRVQRTLAPGLTALTIAPGACVAIAGESGTWRVTDTVFEGHAVTLGLTPVAPASLPVAASSGQVLAAPDRVIGTTLLEVVELPALDDQPLAAPRLLVAANGTGSGWREAALLVSTDDGASWAAAGATAAPATMGTLVTVPAAAPSTLRDLTASVVVALAHDDMLLEDADDNRIDAGANLAMMGEELVQFGRAEPLGDGRWRLGRLLRGRRGTEPAAGTQGVGDRFVLIDGDAVRAIDLPLAMLGARVRVMASGVGDVAGPVERALSVSGCSVVPPSPVHLTAGRSGDGGAAIAWVRRSRAGWRWIDGTDVPLGEEAERYRVVLSRADGSVASLDTTDPAAVAPAGTIAAAIVQVGTTGESSPAALNFA